MSWIVDYESPPTKKMRQFKHVDIDEMLKEVKILLLTGYTIRSIDFGRGSEVSSETIRGD